MKHSNRDLNNEQLNPNYAGEGFLPIGPIYRDLNFQNFSKANRDNPLRNYKNLSDIVREIVEEGEGTLNFEKRANWLLEKVQELGGARAYLEALMRDKASSTPTPEWLAAGELLRQSHLYRFAMIMTELKQEHDLAHESGVDFVASRLPISVDAFLRLKHLINELPGTACVALTHVRDPALDG